jgi:adenylate kinase family enzyme
MAGPAGLLGPDDPLPARPSRVLVAGTSGSGKTTLASRVATVLGLPHTEIDALYHGPGWVPRPEFEDDVRRLVASPAWVTEWQYAPVRALLAERADLLVWLDLPALVTARQVVRRTLRRRLRREALWNGNVEPPLWTFVTDRDHIVRWAWRTRAVTGGRVEGLRRGRPDLTMVRLRRHADAARWLAGPLTASRVSRRR